LTALAISEAISELGVKLRALGGGENQWLGDALRHHLAIGRWLKWYAFPCG